MILICGLPNAGKTTYSSKYENVVHLDDYQENGMLYNKCNMIASKLKNPCVEGIYVTRDQRKRLLKHFSGEKNVCIWLHISLETCIERERNYRDRPLSFVHAYYRAFTPPTLDEGWDEIRIVHEDGHCDIIKAPDYEWRHSYP